MWKRSKIQALLLVEETSNSNSVIFMATPTTELSSHIADQYAKLDETRKSLPSLSEYSGSFANSLAVAQGVSDIRALLDDETMRPVMDMMNSRLGFLTDRDPARNKKTNSKYSVDIVRECLIEATFRGLVPMGNLFNIIAGNCYITKEGFQFLLRKVSRLEELKVNIGLPTGGKGGGTIVTASVSWKLNGKKDATGNVDLSIKSDAYASPDSIRGKAERKIVKIA